MLMRSDHVRLSISKDFYPSTSRCPRPSYNKGAALSNKSQALAFPKISTCQQADVQNQPMIKELPSPVKVRVTISKDIYPATSRCPRPAYDREAALSSKSQSKTSSRQQVDAQDQAVMKELHSPIKEPKM